MSATLPVHECRFRPDERGESVCPECGVVDPTPQFENGLRKVEPLVHTIGSPLRRVLRDGQGKPLGKGRLKVVMRLRKTSRKTHSRQVRIRPEILQLLRLKATIAGLPYYSIQRAEMALRTLAKARAGSGRLLYDETVSAAVYLVKQERREPWSFREMRTKLGGSPTRLRLEIHDLRRLAKLNPAVARPEDYLSRFVGNFPAEILARARKLLAKVPSEAPIRTRPGQLLAGAAVYLVVVEETGPDATGAKARSRKNLTSERIAEFTGASDGAIRSTAKLLQRSEETKR